MEQAHEKADVAFELFDLLDVPFFSFHDLDIAPEGATLRESNKNVRRIADIFAKKMRETGVQLLWGTANLFSNRRYMAGAATNPDPEVFAYAAGAGEERARAHPRPGRRELRSMGRPRGLRDAAQHRHAHASSTSSAASSRSWSSTSTRSASRARS